MFNPLLNQDDNRFNYWIDVLCRRVSENLFEQRRKAKSLQEALDESVGVKRVGPYTFFNVKKLSDLLEDKK